MNYQSVKIFLAIVEHRSISAAARALYITQPAVSGHLNRLEEELGCPLILRQKGVQQITLTPKGEAFVPIATQWIEAEKAVLRFQESCSRRSLRMATGVTAHECIASPLVQKLLGQDPALQLDLNFIESTRFTQNYLKTVEIAQRTDVFISFLRPVPSLYLEAVPFFSEKYDVLCPMDTPLPDRLLHPRELDRSFEIFQSQPSKNLRAWYIEHFPDPSQPYASVAATLTIPSHFRDPRCWAIVPASISRLLMMQHPGRFVSRSVEPTPMRTFYIYISKMYANTEVLHNLFACCREYLAERPYLQSLLPEDI